MVVKKKLTGEAIAWLIRPIYDMEIKKVVLQFNPDKAPGTDGFNAHFFQKYWLVVSKCVTRAVQSFFHTGFLLKEFKHILITLVPKIQHASSLNEYRPISCCQQMYKFISKVLSNRLKQMVGGLVSGYQSAFLSGKQISDCTVLAHEMVCDFKKKPFLRYV